MSSSLSESDVLKIVFAIALLIAGLIGSALPLWTAHHSLKKRGKPISGAGHQGKNLSSYQTDGAAVPAASTAVVDEPSNKTASASDVSVAVWLNRRSIEPEDPAQADPDLGSPCCETHAAQLEKGDFSSYHRHSDAAAGGGGSAAAGAAKTSHIDWFAFLESLSGGVIVSAALVHILADSVDNWDQANPDMPVKGYPFVFMLAGLSCLVIFMIDQLLDGGHHHHDGHDHQHNAGDTHGGESTSAAPSLELAPPASENGVSATPSASVAKMRESLFLVFGALSLHALLEGFALGATSSASQASVIFTAIIVHKVFEGFALGSRGRAAILLSKSLAPGSWVLSIAFCFTTPIGVVAAAAVVQSLNSSSAQVTLAVLLGLAAGSFLYVGLVEVIPGAIGRGNKALNCAGLSIGFAVMSIVAIWA